MAGNGNPDAARLWALADLYVLDYTGDAGTVAATEPTDLSSDLGLVMDLVGLLSQEDQIGLSVTAQEQDHFAYGNRLTRSTFTQEQIQFSATAWEDSDLNFHLANPGSTSEDAGGGLTRRVRKPINTGLAIKTVVVDLEDGEVNKRIWIPRAQVLRTGDSNISDSAISGYPLTIKSLAFDHPDDGNLFFTELTDDSAAALVGS